MRFSSFLAAAALASVSLWASQAGAETFYQLGAAQGFALVIDPASIAASGGGYKTATVYFVETTQAAERRKVEIDCNGRREATRGRTLVRTDGSPLHALGFKPDWEVTNPRDMGGRIAAFVCGLPAIPSTARQASAGSLTDYLRATSDDLRAHRDGSLPAAVTTFSPVGNCILRALPRDVASGAIGNAADGRDPASDPRLRAGVTIAGAKCAGRAESDTDAMTISATVSLFIRLASFASLKRNGPLTEDQLLAAWNGASAATRKPLIDMAGMMGTNSTTQDVLAADRTLARQSADSLLATPEISTVLAKDKGLTETARQVLGYQYFSSVALGEYAEGQLNPPPA